MKESKITLNINLDENKVPSKIEWSSTDDKTNKAPTECKAFLLSLFDKEFKETLRIDLWTKEMQVQEMDRFFFYTLQGMADTYSKSTNNKEMAEHMRQFCSYFGEKTGILKPQDDSNQ